MERFGSARRLARSARISARHEQFSGTHWTSLPRAVRVGVRARLGERARRDPSHRADHRGSRLRRRVGGAASAAEEHGIQRCCNRVGARRPRCRPAATPSRTCRCCLREGRAGWRAASLRNSGIQAGEVGARSPSLAARGGRSAIPHRRRRRRGDHGRRVAGEIRCSLRGDGSGCGTGSTRPWSRARGSPSGDGFPDVAESPALR